MTSFAESSKTYPYAIQMSVFGDSASAARFIEANKLKLPHALVMKSLQYHVLYNAYETKDEASKDLKVAREVSPQAYIFQIRASNQQQVDDLMNQKQALKVDAMAKVADSGTTETSKTAVTPSMTAINSAAAVGAVNQGANASAPNKGQIKVFNQLVQNDILVTGVYGDAMINFTVDSHWKLSSGGYLDVYLSYPSEQFFPDSTLTFFLNGVPLVSAPLGKNEAVTSHLKIPLDPDKIKPGYNVINLKTFVRTAEDLCENQTNPANWIVIGKKSVLHLEYTDESYKSQLSEYPYPYVVSGEDQPVKFSFLYDTGAPNTDVLDGILGMSSDIGRLNPFQTLNYDFESPKAYKPDKSAIYLGTEIPKELKKWLPANAEVPNSDFYIYEAKVSNTSNILFVIAKDPKYLKKLSHMLSYKDVVSQLEKNSMTFRTEDFIDYNVQSLTDTFTLKDLGYSSTTFEATKNPSVAYFVSTPGNWNIASGTKLVLNIRFSRLVDAANSTVTATVNGVPIGSRILDSQSSDGQTVEFLLPKQVLNVNRFNIGLSFSLGGEFKCTDLKSTQGFWVYVSNDSYIQFVKSNKNTYTLSDLPSPMVADSKFKDLSIVMDRTSDLKTIKLIADLMSKFGQQTQSQGDFHVSFDAYTKASNAIVIGTSHDELIKKTNDLAVVPYKIDFNGFQPRDGVVFLSSESKNYATAQMIYNKTEKTSLLWITSPTSEGFDWLGKYLTDAQLSTEIKGDAVFVNRNGLLQVYESPETKAREAKQPNAQSEVTKATFENMRNFLIFLGSLLVVTILLIIYLNKKKPS